MPPSQLKQLKASLRDNGILGPQKSKKQRKANNKDAQKRLQRNAALEGIRERFNPFEAKAPARRDKFDIASSGQTKKTVERPSVTRGLGEERRRATLLKEMQSRNKVGGMLDRRFGEDDPNMTPEQKAAERFAQQALRTSRKNNMFNLEDDSEEELQLTHGGRALDFDGDVDDRTRDDFDEDLSASDADDFDGQDDRPRKRVRVEDVDEDGVEAEEIPQHKKTKHEVMQEVIAKSKAYKAARQAQKEDDDELRAELDQGLADMFAELVQNRPDAKQHLPSPPVTDSEPTLDPGRAALLAGKSRAEAEKEYEANIRLMKMEARSKPSSRTKTEEEKAAEEKARLEELERKRIRRMKGEAESSDDESDKDAADDGEDDEVHDDAEAFGLEQPGPRYMPNLAVEDEDEFVMDDIVASDSEADLASDFDDEDDNTSQVSEDDGDDDFIDGLVLPQKSETGRAAPSTAAVASDSVPFTLPCPQSLEELIQCTSTVPPDALSTVVQRIRALYHKGLAEGNHAKLGRFAQALVPWVAALVEGECPQCPSMQVVEQLLRHLHSMAKAQPHEVAVGFREYLRQLLQEDVKSLSAGDLAILTGVSTTFPTSDQWHPVVTPAMLTLARYLGQAPMDDLRELAKGVYACSLALRYQVRSQRYVPEVMTFICKAIRLLGPPSTTTEIQKCTAPTVLESCSYRITKKSKIRPSARLRFDDLRTDAAAESSSNLPSISAESLLLATLGLVDTCIDYYSTKSAYPELISPVHSLVTDHLSSASFQSLLHPATQAKISALSSRLASTIQDSIASRKPLLLHNHRPLAIKSSYPLFDDQYNPTRKQRDPDAERAELNKLKAEHKKERKGAMRELRKDANFMAREQLKEKKARDEAYEKKFKRLVAEIQGEEGKEAKAYEREKAKRKGRF